MADRPLTDIMGNSHTCTFQTGWQLEAEASLNLCAFAQILVVVEWYIRVIFKLNPRRGIEDSPKRNIFEIAGHTGIVSQIML